MSKRKSAGVKAAAQERQNEIVAYLREFFGTIRSFVTSEPEYGPHVPHVFRFTYDFLIFDCRDGYVVAAYPSGLADNFIRIEDKRAVTQVLATLPNKLTGTDAHFVFKVNDWNRQGGLQAIIDVVQTNQGPVPTTGYKFLYVYSKSQLWPLDHARNSAYEYIRVIKAQASLYKADAPRLIVNYDHAVLRHELIARLHQVLDEFRLIINEVSYRERVVHRYLRDNRVLLYPNKKQLVYEYGLLETERLKYRIDFVVEITSGRYVLVELENPKHRLFTARGDFTRAVNHAVNQVSDWMLFIRERPDAVASAFPDIVAPEGLVIIGRNEHLTQHQRNKIRIHNDQNTIKVITYDDLAEEAENYIRHLLEV